MMMGVFWRFLREKRAAATLEYVVLFLPLIALVFTSFQISLAYHFALTAQKAVENGARVAAVRDPAVRRSEFPTENGRAPNVRSGAPCSLPGNCVVPTPSSWTCFGADLDDAICDPVAFDAIFQEVASLAYLLNPEDVAITYRYAGLGFAGGEFIPIVEVTILEKPFFLQFLFEASAFGGAEDEEDGDGPRLGVSVLPAVTATAIAEDMSSSND